MIDNKTIIKQENYRSKLGDKTSSAYTDYDHDGKIAGHVEVYEGDITDVNNLLVKQNLYIAPGDLVDKDNLIVWGAREIMLQKAFGVERVVGSGVLDIKTSWFSVGAGGADPGDKMEPIAPWAGDQGLTEEIFLDAGNVNYTDGGKKKSFDTFELQQDNLNGNSYLIARLQIVVDITDANGNDVSEAALWMSDSDDPTQASIFHLFSKVTFSSIRKHSKRKLTFIWYIYF